MLSMSQYITELSIAINRQEIIKNENEVIDIIRAREKEIIDKAVRETIEAMLDPTNKITTMLKNVDTLIKGTEGTL